MTFFRGITRLYGAVIADACFVGLAPGVAGAGTYLIGDVMSQSVVGGMGMDGHGHVHKRHTRSGGRNGGEGDGEAPEPGRTFA